MGRFRKSKAAASKNAAGIDFVDFSNSGSHRRSRSSAGCDTDEDALAASTMGSGSTGAFATALNESFASSNDYVTQPPVKNSKRLTGKISTLFRRDTSGSTAAAGIFSSSTAGDVSPAVTIDDLPPDGDRYDAAPIVAATVAAGGVTALVSNDGRTRTPQQSNHNSSSSAQRNASPRNSSSAQRNVSPRSGSAPRNATSRSDSAPQNATSRSSSAPRNSTSRSRTNAMSPQQQQQHRLVQLQQQEIRRKQTQSGGGKRIFYSSNMDEDSDDDSYESRASRHRGATSSKSRSRGAKTTRGVSRYNNNTRGAASYDDDETDNDTRTTYDDDTMNDDESGYSGGDTVTTNELHQQYRGIGTAAAIPADGGNVRRYRGFSTSIQNLFLDEPLVCAACGCFGLILSNRTEYLLQLRNERRGVLHSSRSRRKARSKNLPSRILAGTLLLMLFLMFLTFVVWGFGTGNGVARDYMQGYDYDMNGNDDGYNSNDDNGAVQEWDDYLANNQDNNDNYYNNYYNNDDNDGGGNDDGNNNNNNDNNNNENYNNDENQQQNDENNGEENNENNNNEENNNGEDENNGENNNDNNRQRRVVVSTIVAATGNRTAVDSYQQQRNYNRQPHFNGVFKLREYHETLWEPALQYVQNTNWYRIRQDTDMLPNSQPQQFSSKVQHPGVRRWVEEEDRDSNDADDDSANTDTNDDGNNYASSFAEYQQRHDIASYIRIGLLVMFLAFLGILGRRRRMRTRFYIVRARAQEDHLYYASSDAAAARRVAYDDTREDQYEGACSHTMCGCYPTDEVAVENSKHAGKNSNSKSTNKTGDVKVGDNGIFKSKTQPYNEDIVARCFSCLMGCCCGVVFRCWCQCMSICSLAQEAREVRLLIPPRYQRIDFITHQPFHEYQEAVNDLRRGWLGKARRMSGCIPHLNALSRLSRYILVISLVTIAAIVATLVFNPRAAFSWEDAVVLAATFVQSFLVLFFVHWIFHKSDLSLDAVIKMFAAGFLIAVPTAFLFEGLLVNVVLFTAWIVYDALDTFLGDGFGYWVVKYWRSLWIISELFNAYIVAAVTEELCKYYTFRAVEHPDLVFLTGLQRERQDDKAMEGGLVQYPFASHQVQEFVRSQSFESSHSRNSNGSHRSNNSRRSKQSKRRGEQLIEETGTTDAEYEEDELDVRTHRQKAMAITTAMISVAVGLACAENFIYVFVLGGAVGEDNDDSHRGDVMEAWVVLFFRSIFPVHALAAAMQSINVIRKFVEHSDQDGHRIGVGRIVLPALILHGTFDAILMGINVYVETAWQTYLDDNNGDIGDEEPYNVVLVNVLAWVSISIIMILGFVWYYVENRKQRNRLKLLEEKEKALSIRPWTTPDERDVNQVL